MKKRTRIILIILSVIGGLALATGIIFKEDLKMAQWTFQDIVHPKDP